MKMMLLVFSLWPLAAVAQYSTTTQMWLHAQIKWSLNEKVSFEWDAEERRFIFPDHPTSHLLSRVAVSRQLGDAIRIGAGFGFFLNHNATSDFVQKEPRPHLEATHALFRKHMKLDNRIRWDLRFLDGLNELGFSLANRLRHRINWEYSHPLSYNSKLEWKLHFGNEWMLQESSGLKNFRFNQNRIMPGFTFPITDQSEIDLTYFYLILPRTSFPENQNIIRITFIHQLNHSA